MTTIGACSNQSIKAILDEYYEGESYLESSDGSDRSDVIDAIHNDFVFSTSSSGKDGKPPSEISTYESQSSIVDNTKEIYLHTVSPASSGESKVIPTNQTTKSMTSFNEIDQVRTNQTAISQKAVHYENLGQDLSEKNTIISSVTEFPHNTGHNTERKPTQSSREVMCSDDSTIKMKDEIPDENISVSKVVNKTIDMTNVLPLDQEDSSQYLCQKKKQKKPFLKRGSRKEPSSLQRMNTDVVGNGMRFKNEARVEDEVTSDKTTTSNHLKQLEQMQQEQLDHLQKRLERREKARIAIEQKKMCNKTQSIDSKKDLKDRNTCQNEQPHVFNDQKGDSSDDESSDGLSSDEETSDDSSNEDSSFEKNDQRMAPTKRTYRNVTTKTLSKLGNQTNKNRVSSFSRFHKRDKESEQQLKEFKSPEIKEQWQVIKSMRKRQEAALRSAEKQREEARLWATNERENVRNWAEQQRSLIKKERKRVMNDVLSSQRKKRQQEQEERAAAAAMDSQKQLRGEVETLETTLQKLKVDHDVTKSRFRLNEKKLRDLISERDKTIEFLRKDIESLNTKHTRMQKERNDLFKFKEDTLRKKKKKKKQNNLNQSPNLEQNHTDKDKEKSRGDSSIYEETATCVREVIDPTDPQSDQENISTLGECQEHQCDKEAIRIIATRQDLVEKPTEEWLQKHLEGFQNRETDKKIIDDQDCSFITPMKRKTYNPEKYGNTPHPSVQEDTPPESSKYEDNQIEQSLSQANSMQRSAVKYRNGTQKEILPDGTIVVKFTNGDTKTTYSNIGIVVYYYAESKTSHTTHPDGLEIFEYASGQVERHYLNGRKEVQFPDGTQQVFLPSGDRLNSFPDGVNMMESSTGTKIIQQRFN